MGRAIHSAHELLATNERELYDLSQSDMALVRLSPAQRRLQLQRARAMRDRARALYRRQVGHTLHHTATKRGFTGMANERTRQKAQVLSEVVRRLAGEPA
ncbi:MULTISPECIES: hypothetical protein [Comamonas]|uniref:hypothetical protein n=1 Tax=Comamonas TaxID=283 RepID=UPI0011E7824C|nr:MULTISPECIES: hypothetical protein [Comamonas]MDH1477209.1 hypothetical protein [Comamonas thiooxydans]TYK74417.1 hypothetical protein FSY45_18240 [Comamonas sp. Z1]BCX51719.1 hypothetical protein CTYAZ2_13010 [Comamonas testosteroni]